MYTEYAGPARARALARLATVRWELDPPLTQDAAAGLLSTIELASSLAPRLPAVQMQLGELLLKMGRERDALPYLARALELEPDRSAEVVRLLGVYLFSAGEIYDAMSPTVQLVAALERPFFDQGEGEAYLTVVEQSLARAAQHRHSRLLESYGNACLALAEPRRLLSRLDALGPQSAAAVEAERLRQRARALIALGAPEEAIVSARDAAAAQPESTRFAEHYGDISIAARNPDEALSGYREALRLLALSTGAANQRARVYRKIGHAEEAAGRPHLAYDAYRMALRLNPDETFAARRVQEMEESAGFR